MSPVGWERQALNSIQSVLGRPPGRQRAATGHPACELAAIRYDPQDTQPSDIDLRQREITVRGRAGKPRAAVIAAQSRMIWAPIHDRRHLDERANIQRFVAFSRFDCYHARL